MKDLQNVIFHKIEENYLDIPVHKGTKHDGGTTWVLRNRFTIFNKFAIR